MMAGLSLSAAACSAATSSTARNALSDLRKPIFARLSSCSIKLWPFEVIRCLEGEKRRHTHDNGTENFIADVEVIVREAAPLASQDAVVGILGGILRHGDTEGRPLLHALEDEVDAVDILPDHSP